MIKSSMRSRVRFFWLALFFLNVCAYAGPNKIGNGDEGADLEGATSITTGPIVEARDQAIALLKKLNVEGVNGLGLLLP